MKTTPTTPTSNQIPKTIIFGVNKQGEIVQFDKKSQDLTGYDREEVLHRKLWDTLIPESHLTEWKHLIDQVQKNQQIDNIKIPWKTAHGTEIMLNLSSFPLDTKQKNQETYCFIGQPLSPTTATPPQTPTTTNTTHQPTSPPQKSPSPTNQTITTPSIENFSNTTASSIPPLELKKIELLQEKYATLEQRIKDLEIKNRHIEQHNQFLEDIIKNLDQPKNSTQNNFIPVEITDTDSKVNKLSKFTNIFSKNKKHNEHIQLQLHNIEQKAFELNEKEKQLNIQSTNIEKKISDLKLWKEKLVELELEIQKREDQLLDNEWNQQSEISEHLKTKTLGSTSNISSPLFIQINQEQLYDQNNCAAVLQRGIFKDINPKLTEILGFSYQDLVEKSFYDLIAPEGLADIEQFHLNRLKGKTESTYSTIVFDKDNNKIVVEIEMTPILYNQQKAELAIFILKQKIDLEQKTTSGEKIEEKGDEGE
ncbi:MAG: PAS domain S-box protein [Candidatus Thermoplasmatota archaeon]|nr:PAS domain S-box protein [Candidatus Thermoplasmatota archaeon]MBU1941490.1 PAS domain S-box protein [Candidatus Thermoplasmatota archaeon]